MTAKRAKQRVNSHQQNIIELHDAKQSHKFSKKRSQVNIIPRNLSQEEYVLKLNDPLKNIVFALGPAGTGKTLLACQMGIKMFKEGQVDKIIVTRPAVSTDEDLGFLPGTLEQKMAPWTRPIFDVLSDYYHTRDIENMMQDGVIEISPLAYMRGRTFHNAYIIADEMQGTTVNQMKMLLTRIGDNSKLVVTGDLNQADRLGNNGLADFVKRIQNQKCQYITVATFDHKDIERHPAVGEVLKIYEE